jgi:hypothetical protein
MGGHTIRDGHLRAMIPRTRVSPFDNLQPVPWLWEMLNRLETRRSDHYAIFNEVFLN